MFLYQFAKSSHRLFPSWWGKYKVWKFLCLVSLYLPEQWLPQPRQTTEETLIYADLGKFISCELTVGKNSCVRLYGSYVSTLMLLLCMVTMNISTSRSVATRAVFLQTKLIFQLYIFPLIAESRHKKSVLCVLRKSLPLNESVCLFTRANQFIYITCWCNDW